MKSATFSVTCTQGSNRAKLSGEIYYEGYHSKTTSGGYFRYWGQQYGFFNVVATKVSGGDFTARFYALKASNSDLPLFEIDEGRLASLSTNGSNSVAWDGPEYCIYFYDDFDGGSAGVGTARIYVRFYVDWGSGETYADSSTISFQVPKSEKRVLVFNGNGGTVVGGFDGAAFTPTSSFPSITLSRYYPTRENYEFYRWSDTTDGSGSVSFTGGPGNEWDGSGAGEGWSDGKTLYAIWNPLIRFDANGGLDNTIPASFYKTHNVASTVPSTTPLHASKMFSSWNTAREGNDATFQRGATIAAGINWTLTLYAQWRDPTAAPTISSITVIRCNSSGTSDDLGTYAKITATWSVDRTYDSSNTGLVTGRYRVSGSSSTTSFAFSSGTTGASGTATKIVSGMNTDTQYEFIVEVQDSNSDAHHTNVTERAVVLTRAKFIMDLRAGGEAMGLFSAAPPSGLEVGKNAQFDGNITVLGNVTVSGSVTASNLSLTSESGSSVASASSNFTLSSAYGYKYGPIRMVSVTIAAGSALTVGTNYTMGTLASAYSVPRPMGFANQYGVGYVSGSTIYFKPLVSVNSSTSLYVALTYIKP